MYSLGWRPYSSGYGEKYHVSISYLPIWILSMYFTFVICQKAMQKIDVVTSNHYRHGLHTELNKMYSYSFVFFFQGRCGRVHLSVSLKRIWLTLVRKHNCTVLQKTIRKRLSLAQTFWTWLISSCLRFWLRVIFRSLPSMTSAMIEHGTSGCVFDSIFCLRSKRSIVVHSSRRRFTSKKYIES